MAKNVATTSVLFGTTVRPLADIMSEDMVNVKWFGAMGDDDNDDTGAIQAAINEACGVFAPGPINTIKSQFRTRKVFFPPGIYRVYASEDAVYGGSSTYPGGAMFKCADNMWESSALHITAGYTAGSSGFVGSGKYATIIKGMTNGAVLHGNGWSHGVLQDLCIQGTGLAGSRCFEWARIGSTHPSFPIETHAGVTGPASDNPINQAGLTAVNCAFINADDCVRLGTGNDGMSQGNDQSSEVVWMGCDFRNAMRTGLSGGNGNCLNINFLGCNFDRCGLAGLGAGPISYPFIIGCRFTNNGLSSGLPNLGAWENYSRCDIAFDSSSTSVIGCYSNSSNFINYSGSVCLLNSCLHEITGPIPGESRTGQFSQVAVGPTLIENSVSLNGVLQRFTGGGAGTVYIRGRGGFPTAGAFDDCPGIAENI